MLSGLIIVRVEVAERWHAELLGEGDLISPWLPAAPELADVSARILEPVEVAVLDRQFALRTARWPEIHAGLMRRLIARSRRLSLQSAINSIPRTQERLELTLWQFANRFGRVALGGLRLHLPMSHAQLATIVGAQRPSVTIALSRLQEAGRIVRTRPNLDGSWQKRATIKLWRLSHPHPALAGAERGGGGRSARSVSLSLPSALTARS